MKSKEFIIEETLTESALEAKVRDIVQKLEQEIAATVTSKMTGKRKTMMALKDESVRINVLHVKSPSSRVWTRGDGSRYREPGDIRLSGGFKRFQRQYSTFKKLFPTEKDLINHVWETLQGAKGSKDMGEVSGEFGSSKYSPALVVGGLLWVKSENRIEYGSPSRLNNTSIWHRRDTESSGQVPVKNQLMKITKAGIKVKGHKKPIGIGQKVKKLGSWGTGDEGDRIAKINPEDNTVT